jgi:hypothetical protein
MTISAFLMRIALLISGLFIPSVFSQEDQCGQLSRFPIMLGA